MNFQKPKGTEDFYPEDKETQQAIFAKVKSVAKRYNFREVETPAFEELKLLTQKQGDEIKSQIFLLEKRSSEEFGLRFDLTVPLTRLFVQKQRELQKPVKWFCVDKMWRYEQPQKGRQREFYQFDVEMLGSSEPESDAEIINLMISCVKELGLTSSDVVMKINNRYLLQGLLSDFVSEEKFSSVLGIIDKFEKLSRDAFVAELELLNVDAKRIIKIITTKSLDELEKQFEGKKFSEMASLGLENIKKVFSFVSKEFVELSLSTVRGLAYYTGTVFEMFDRQGKFRAVCGGGRYDNLVEQYGGEKTPAVGVGMGYSTLLLLLEDRGLLPPQMKRVDYYVAVLSDDVRTEALNLVEKLRVRNVVETDFVKRSFSKQLQYANTIGASKLIVIGIDEVKRGKYKIKDLGSGSEEEVSF